VKPLAPISLKSRIKRSLPGRIESLFRIGGTVKLVNALMRDQRVAPARKVCFAASLAGIIGVMLFPELIADGFLASILPFISGIIGVPIEAGFDWFTFVMLLPILLRIFPSDIMEEHYLRVFKGKKPPVEPGSYQAKVITPGPDSMIASRPEPI
jgi:hypothetical protein